MVFPRRRRPKGSRTTTRSCNFLKFAVKPSFMGLAAEIIHFFGEGEGWNKSIRRRHFQGILLGKFPNLPGEPENSLLFRLESGEPENFQFLETLQLNFPLGFFFKKFYGFELEMALKKSGKFWLYCGV